MSQRAFWLPSFWLVGATFFGGVFNFGVHFFAKRIPESDYGVFVAMVSLLSFLAIPSLGLQSVFAQQTAAALTDPQLRELRGTARGVLKSALGLWLVCFVSALAFQDKLVKLWKISQPPVLWLTLALGLAVVWIPVLSGILQGKQRFGWLACGMWLNGLGRIVCVAILVLWFLPNELGMVLGVFTGTAFTVAIYGWQTRDVWTGPQSRVDWKEWRKRILYLTVGYAAFQTMLTVDPILVQMFFDKDKTAFYMAAGVFSKALVTFTVPIVWVMFPIIVRSIAKAEKTNALSWTLGATAFCAGSGACLLWLLAPWLLRWVYKESYLEAVPLIPKFATSMVLLTLAHVLINNLMARCQFRAVWWLLAVAALYASSLYCFHKSFDQVLWVLLLGNLAFLATAIGFTWTGSKSSPAPSQPGTGPG